MSANDEKQFECMVCGKQSSRVGYGVPSCEGCRHFFRRIVASQKRLMCFNGRRCRTEKSKCRSCRLDSCIEAGMDWKNVKIAGDPLLADYAKDLESRKRRIEQRNSRMPSEEPEEKSDAEVVVEVTPMEPPQLMEQHPNSLQVEWAPQLVANQHMQVAQSSVAAKQCFDANFFKLLMDLEAKRYRIWGSYFDVPDHYMDKFSSLADLLTSGHNILSCAEAFNPYPVVLSQKQMRQLLEEVDRSTHLHPRWAKLILVDRLLVIGVVKALPFFARLALEDQMKLIRKTTIPIVFFCNTFYSSQVGSGTSQKRDGTRSISYFTTPRYENDPRMIALAERNFTRSVTPFLRSPITREEFILCLTIIHSHAGAISGLSAEAKELLYEESVRCSKLLLQFQQSVWGAEKGASRYANCMQLIENSFRSAHHHEEFVIYLEAFHLKKSITMAFPDCLKAIV